MEIPHPPSPHHRTRPAGNTEHSWCKAVPGGTGATVLALLFTKPPDLHLLQLSFHRLLLSHPLLRSKLHFSPTSSTFSFIVPSSPHLPLHSFDLESTSQIIRRGDPSLSPFQKILELELSLNPWSSPQDPASPHADDVDVFHTSVYELQGSRWVVVLKVHTAVCDRTAGDAVIRELMGMMINKHGGGGDGAEEVEVGVEGNVDGNLAIEECIPRGKGKKPFWARGKDMLGYSLNAFRLSNLDFVDAASPRCTEMVRFLLDLEETTRLLEACRSRDIKLSGALAAAALIAARVLQNLPGGQWGKYAVTTLVDCRPILEPPLSREHVGFYHSAILNSHDLRGGEEVWELARRVDKSYNDAKDRNKHFTDMADLNFLMCKAIDNPGLTPSSSLRTSFISVFEDLVIDEARDHEFQVLGVEDYIGCSTIHGVGPSIGIFDTLRNGKLDCICVYPAPLHSREQMQELIKRMKMILLDGSTSSR